VHLKVVFSWRGVRLKTIVSLLVAGEDAIKQLGIFEKRVWGKAVTRAWVKAAGNAG